MCDKDDGSGEIGEIAFEDFESWDVKVVGRLVEDQNVSRLQHEARDVNAGALSAGEVFDREIELFGFE